MRNDLDLTDQQVFDKMVSHLRQQNAKALSENIFCVYRAEDGKKCPVGIFLSDDIYSQTMEGKRITQLYQEAEVDFELEMFLRGHLTLLRDMQDVHDKRYVSDWEQYFRYVAAKHCLLLDGLPVEISKHDNPLVPEYQKKL